MTPKSSRAAANREYGYLITRSWTRLWWCGSNPHTVYRALTRERLIATLSKAKKGEGCAMTHEQSARVAEVDCHDCGRCQDWRVYGDTLPTLCNACLSTNTSTRTRCSACGSTSKADPCSKTSDGLHV